VFLIQVGQTTATSATALGQQFLSSTISQAVQNLQATDLGPKNLNWTTFSQIVGYQISGSVTTTQATQPVFGQVFALLNPKTHLGAEIYTVSANSSNYSAVNASVLNMIDSLAD
jgi:hypothetical protein